MGLEKNSRLESLEERFSNLASQLKASPEKEAISVLHAIILETRGQSKQNGSSAVDQNRGDQGVTFDTILNLYKSAPAMEGKAENRGLSVGETAPDFTLLDMNGQPVSLKDFRGQLVVLAFYPLDWSPACSDQLSLYQSEIQTFEKYNAKLLAISVDSIYSHGAWAAVRGLSFPLLADFHPKGEVARRYQVMRSSDGFSERALYVIDEQGIIRYVHISPELHMIPSIYELIDSLDSLEKKLEPAKSGNRSK